MCNFIFYIGTHGKRFYLNFFIVAGKIFFRNPDNKGVVFFLLGRSGRCGLKIPSKIDTI
jgi:hypothetical protein